MEREMAAFSTPNTSYAPPFRVLLDNEAEDDNALNLSFQKPLLQDRENPFNIPEDMFCVLFKLTKDMVRVVIDSVRQWSNTQDDFSIDLPLERQVLTTLMVYANGEYESWSGGLESSLDEASAKAVVRQVTMAISASMLHRLSFPSTQESREAAKEAFRKSAHPFPGAMGCMDGFHVKIARPDFQPEHFWNPATRCHTLNVQLVCGPDTKIIYVNPRYPGQFHDNIIWQESTVFKNMSSTFASGERDTWLLGDGNYALQPWLMTPIPPGLVDPGTPEESYNEAHAKALSAVDKCISSLRGTWRILNRKMDYEAVLCANIVNACCVLHNMRCAGNAPPIADAPKRKRPIKRRRVEDKSQSEPAGAAPQPPQYQEQLVAESARLEEQVAALQGHIGAKEQSEKVAPAGAVQILSAEEQLRVESSRLEEQLAALQEQMRPQEPRRVLGNQAAAWNILANKAALVEDPSAIVFDAKNGGRKTELDLARRLQAKLVAQHFTHSA